MTLASHQRRALVILAGFPAGAPVTSLLVHGFQVDQLTELVRDGFATVKREPVDTPQRRVEAAVIEITRAGREAIAEAAC